LRASALGAAAWTWAGGAGPLAAREPNPRPATAFDSTVVILTLADSAGGELRLTSRDWAGLPRARLVLADTTARGRINRRQYEGVRLATLLAVYGLAPEDTAVAGAALRLFIIAEDTAGLRVVFSLAEIEPTIGGHRVLLADRLNGSPIDSGAHALWLIAPDDGRRARWLRAVRRIEVRAATPMRPRRARG
jgi:hypothetical protein